MGKIYKYTKNVYFHTANGVTQKNIVGSAISLDRYTWVNEGGRSGTSGVGWQYYNAGFFSSYAIQYYFNKSASENFAVALVRGTGKSLAQYAEDVISFIETKLAASAGAQSSYNRSFATDSDTPADMRSEEQGMFGSSEHGTWVFPNISISIQENQYNPGDLSRDVKIYISANLSRDTWSNGKWDGNTGYNVTPIYLELSGKYTAAMQDMVKQFFVRLNSVNVALGMGVRDNQSGNTFNFSEYRNYEDRWVVNVTGDPALSDNGYANVIYYGGNKPVTAGNWNSSTIEIDPTDPNIEPDPYDPVPPDPKPPGPDPDPTPIVDPIPIPDMPPIDGVVVGLYRAYRPSSSQLQQIASKLWDPNAWNAIKQMFTNPMEAIFGLAIVPVNPVVGASLPVYLGRYNTEVSVPVVASDYVNVDCGSVAIKKFYGSYLDHDPYTKYSLYLPYIGEMDINADEITGRVMHIEYHCNVVTGDVTALVALDDRVCYTGMGNFIRQLPVSQTDFSSIIQTAVNAASTILTTAVAGSGGVAVADAASKSEKMTMAKTRAEARVDSTVANGSTSLLNDVMGAKFSYKHAGKIGQGAGQLSVQKPFLTITRPNLALPENNDLSEKSNLKAYTGYPCNKILQLSSCHGFTQIEACKLEIPDATDEEVAEVYELLRGGVLF